MERGRNMAKRKWPQDKCCICGEFVKLSGKTDKSFPFGSSYDYEPPDAEWYCNKCARAQYKAAIKVRHLPTNWIPANWERKAARKMGFIRIGPTGAAWGSWFDPTTGPIRDGYVEQQY
jgi:hypothetical protein